ncbi:MAG TPA: ATP-binding cassette domain-containing protein, partial [Candidatus Sulfomarinibacteraceae bacterium]|nr:ATP-binding cassette domain-containing protein [Candidatus Sulfomarinibacteraceae bacterium]
MFPTETVLFLNEDVASKQPANLAAASAVAVRVQNVYKVFGRERNTWLNYLTNWRSANGHEESGPTVAVDGVSFEIMHGEVFGVLGPNGSGKSTLIRLIATLLIPDEGQISVFGHDVVHEPAAVQRMLNRVSVEASFFKKLSPMENLLYAARLYGLEGARVRREVHTILERLDIPKKNINQPMD